MKFRKSGWAPFVGSFNCNADYCAVELYCFANALIA